MQEPSRLGARIRFGGTVAQFEAALLCTEMHRYAALGETALRDGERRRRFPLPISRTRVLAVYNARGFSCAPRQAADAASPEPAATCPAGDNCNLNGTEGIAPPDWSFIYDVGPLYQPRHRRRQDLDGTGVTIAIVGVTDISQADLTAFRTRYSLAANNITKTVVPNTGAAQGGNGAGLEAVLDTEWAGAIAPSAPDQLRLHRRQRLQLIEDAAYYAIEQNFGGVLSESWGGCEAGATPSDADVLEIYGSAASLMGITYVASLGNSGRRRLQRQGRPLREHARRRIPA